MSTGIPQSFANPLQTEFDRPWAEQEAAHARAMDQWRNESLGTIYDVANDWETASKGKTFDLDFAPDHETAKRDGINHSYLSVLNDGNPIGGGPLGAELFRDQVAMQRFQGRGVGDWNAFHAEIKREGTERKEQREFIFGPANPPKQKEGETPKPTLTERLREDAIEGRGWEQTYLAWRRESSTDARFHPDKAGQYMDQAEGYYRQVSEQIEAARPFSDAAIASMRDARDNQTGFATGGTVEAIMQAPKELRPTVISLILTEAKKDGDQSKKGWHHWQGFGRSLARQMLVGPAATMSARDLVQAEEFLSTVKAGDEFGGRFRDLYSKAAGNSADSSEGTMLAWLLEPLLKNNTATAESIAEAKATLERNKDAFELSKQVESIAFGVLDPLKPGDSFFERKISQPFMEGVAPSIASGLLARRFTGSGAGAVFTMWGAMADDDAQQLLQQNPGMSMAQAYDIGQHAAVYQAGLEYAQVALSLGSTKLLGNALATAKASAWKTAAKAGAANFAAENFIEGVQPLIPGIVQELTPQAPDAPWNQILSGYWTERADTFFMLLPTMVMAGGGAAMQAKASLPELQRLAEAAANESLLKAAGVKEPARRALIAEQDPIKRLNLLNGAMQDTDATIAAEGRAEMDRQTRLQQDAAAILQEVGFIPRVVRNDGGGFTLYETRPGDTFGQEIGTATTPEEAGRMAAAHAKMVEDADADRITALLTTYQAAEASGEWAKSVDRDTTTDIDLGTVLESEDAAARSDASRQRVEAQERVEGGDGSISNVIFGESVTETQAGQMRTTNKILSGGNVLTVFHEEAHGFRKIAHARGVLTLADDLAILRGVDSFLSTRTGREGQRVALLPEGFDTMSEADQRVAIDEGISQLVEAEIIHTRKGGGQRPIPAGIVSRNLAAITRLAGPDATRSFRAFIRAFREFFGLAVDRARLIKQGLADGSIDQAKYDDYLAKLFGQQDQQALDQAARDAESALTEGMEIGPDAEGNPFSLGPAKLAGAIQGDVVSRIRAPEQRIEVMSRMARAMENLRLQAERLELLQGGKRLKKSLRKEAAMREAQRHQELENEAYSRHYGILSNDDLTRIKAQPAHAHLADPSSPLHGRLMSKSKAIEKHPDLFQIHRPGDYDGSDGISRSVFGGTLMPDQAAQELYEAGIIKEPTADALWDILRAEQGMVDSFKEARRKAMDDIRNARTQAKQETNEWLATQVETQQANYSPKEEIIRTLGLLDAILNVMPYEIRGKVGGHTQLARIGSDALRLEYLRERLAKVDELMEGWLRVQYGREMDALLKRARPEKDEAGKRPKGKIGADVHALFRSIEAAMGMSLVEAEAEAVKLETLATDEGITPEQQSHATLEANMIRLAANWHHADSARREAAVREATRLLQDGYAQHQVEVSAKREQRAKQRDELKAFTGKAGDREERNKRARKDARKVGRTLQSMLSLLSFEQIVHHAFGENSPVANMLVDWERRASNAREDSVQNKVDAVESLFADLAGGKFRGEQLRHQLAEPGTVAVTTHRGEQTFSQLEAVAATLMWRQEDGRRHMEGHINDDGQAVGEWHWTQDNIDAIEDQLTDAAKAVRLHLSEEYAAEYDRLNPVFRQLYGVDMPRHKNYSPLTVMPSQMQAGQVQDPVTGAGMSGVSLTPGALRNRMQTGVAEPDFRDALQTYLAHIRQMEHFMAYAPFATEAMALINTRQVGNSVEAAAGKETLNVLRLWLDHFAQGGNRDASSHLALNQSFNRKIGRVAASALVGRASVLVIQSLQLGAGLAQMPTGAFLKRFSMLMTGQLGWNAARKSEFIQRRAQQMPPLVRQALEGLMASKPSRLKYSMARLGELIGGADALFTAGTYAIIYDYQLTQAKKDGRLNPEAHAREQAEIMTERVAQPTRSGTRSLYEVTATNPAVKLLWAFASEPRQKLALAAYAVAKKPMGEKMRALAVTWLVGGAGAALIRAVMRDIRDDEDDELLDSRHWDPTRLVLSSLTGPLQGIPIFGDLIEGGIFKATGEYLPGGNMFSGPERAIGAAGRISDWDEREWEDILGDIEAILGGLAPFSDSAAAATSASHVITDTAKILDNFLGN
jgi:hypothetical protein